MLGLAGIVAPGEGLAVAPGVLAIDLPFMVAVAVACLPIFFTGGTVVLDRRASLVDVASPLAAGGSITLHSGRGPPAGNADSNTLLLDLFRALLHRSPLASLTAGSGRVTATTEQFPSQAPYLPPPGTTLILAAVGGTRLASSAGTRAASSDSGSPSPKASTTCASDSAGGAAAVAM